MIFKNNSNTIKSTISIRETVKKMDVENKNSLVVINKENKVCGIFSMGDFRRAVLNGLDINKEISTVINKNFKYLNHGYSKNDAKEIFERNILISEIPILNKKSELIKILTRKEILINYELGKQKFNLKDTTVIIMAGGKGTRLDPFTRILPKPLIPFGNDPIVKIIMDNFNKFKVNNFYISINDKGKMIKAYFYDHKFSYKIQYIEEDKPLGTVGALKLLKDKIKNTFFVTNCDILINSHFPSIMKFHKNSKYDFTLVTSMRNYTIPYGVCDIDKSGQLLNMREKPEYNYLVNTGMYVVEPKVLKFIPKNKIFDMSDLIKKIKGNGMKVGVFPISEKSWVDIGQWKEYKKNLK